MKRVPKRVSLVGEVIDILRADLRAGRWKEFLPSESTLTAEFRVSRDTLRLALTALQRDGMLISSQGRRRKIVAKAQPHARVESHIVGWLEDNPINNLSPSVVYFRDQIRRHLHDLDRELVFRVMPRPHSADSETMHDLERIVSETQASCWVLSSAREAKQRWFSERQP